MTCIFSTPNSQTVHWKTTSPASQHLRRTAHSFQSGRAGELCKKIIGVGWIQFFSSILWYLMEKWPWRSDALCQAPSTIYSVDPFTLLLLPLGPWLWWSYRLELSLMLTPWKINMEPTNQPFRKEHDLPNLHDYVPCLSYRVYVRSSLSQLFVSSGTLENYLINSNLRSMISLWKTSSHVAREIRR